MTVVAAQRRPNERMEVQTKATELAAYTIQAAGNEHVCPKHHRWSLGARLTDSALAVARHIDIANSLSLDEDYPARREHQRLALAETFALMTLVHTARAISHFPSDRLSFWIGSILDLQTLLRGWMDSDRRRSRKPSAGG